MKTGKLTDEALQRIVLERLPSCSTNVPEGPGTGLDCEHHTGIHYWADYYIMELIDPDTLEPVPRARWGRWYTRPSAKRGLP